MGRLKALAMEIERNNHGTNIGRSNNLERIMATYWIMFDLEEGVCN